MRNQGELRSRGIVTVGSLPPVSPSLKGAIFYLTDDDGIYPGGEIYRINKAGDAYESIKGSTSVYYEEIKNTWDVDLGSKPRSILNGPFGMTSFTTGENIAIYTDVQLGSAYDSTIPLYFGLIFKMSSDADTNVVDVRFGYGILKEGDDPSSVVYINRLKDITPDGTDNMQVSAGVEWNVPAQPGYGPKDLLTIMFSRYGAVDSNTANLEVATIFLYQDA
jgi:hypothetical protein